MDLVACHRGAEIFGGVDQTIDNLFSNSALRKPLRAPDLTRMDSFREEIGHLGWKDGAQ
jgi:hypothetical protein